ncbi:NUDIX hydrolase [Variovorax sp. PBL-E5]|uniref:NUDIX hydrolase n=1 Tax=Variovorax sp. PBL-E5 TaxID=434014 RepID=UPI00131629F5|nr:NUDIX hydrolase [Variovorax sp. PBL-E5]VTU30540.1 NUDIX domain protein [Variovorax sp. PBL-E5]
MSAVPSAAPAPSLRPSSTLILLRDASQGLEVLMLKRHGQSAVLGDTFVFPGGKVDGDDVRLDAARHLDASVQTLHARLGEPEIDVATAAGFYVAALREAFEEAGLLLAQGLSPEACTEARARLGSGVAFNALVAELGLRLQVDALAPWSRWITPVRSVNKQRFDTRFFVARTPAQGIVRHDGHETTEAAWLRPRAALETYWDGGMALAPPQIMTLAHLARHDAVDAVLADARSRLPALVAPRVLGEGDTLAMCYPGDQEHPVCQRAMPGPLRLLVRGKRYEPQGGFDAFFA